MVALTITANFREIIRDRRNDGRQARHPSHRTVVLPSYGWVPPGEPEPRYQTRHDLCHCPRTQSSASSSINQVNRSSTAASFSQWPASYHFTVLRPRTDD